MESSISLSIDSMDELHVRALYSDLLKAWNQANAFDYANLFEENGNVVGFDGSQMNGKHQIQEELSKIFGDHTVASYVFIIEEVRALDVNVYLLRATAGMVAPGKSEIIPERNAIQMLVATKRKDVFRISLFQNTPAAFHGRQELSKELTERLQRELDAKIEDIQLKGNR